MYGPKPQGTWTATALAHGGGDHQSLRVGQRYRVMIQFTDYDKSIHPVGEEWTFLGHSFLPYEEGVSFFVSLDGVLEWHLRLQWRPEEQAEVLDHLDRYLSPVVAKH